MGELFHCVAPTEIVYSPYDTPNGPACVFVLRHVVRTLNEQLTVTFNSHPSPEIPQKPIETRFERRFTYRLQAICGVQERLLAWDSRETGTKPEDRVFRRLLRSVLFHFRFALLLGLFFIVTAFTPFSSLHHQQSLHLCFRLHGFRSRWLTSMGRVFRGIGVRQELEPCDQDDQKQISARTRPPARVSLLFHLKGTIAPIRNWP